MFFDCLQNVYFSGVFFGDFSFFDQARVATRRFLYVKSSAIYIRPSPQNKIYSAYTYPASYSLVATYHVVLFFHGRSWLTKKTSSKGLSTNSSSFT